MLDIDRCRELLGPGCPLTDEELALLREQMYLLAQMLLSAPDNLGAVTNANKETNE